MSDIINIALNQLTAWKGNVRKTQNKGFIDELAASIKAHGLQQNLIVSKDGKKYAVIAGGQRLKALQQLAKTGDIEAAHPVTIACAKHPAARAFSSRRWFPLTIDILHLIWDFSGGSEQ